MLNTVVFEGPSDAPPLLMAHGLFGSARNLGVIAKRLSAGRQVTVADMRNHADSPWFDDHGYVEMAGDLANLIAAPTDVMGHSMGGKAAMMLALTAPERVRKLVVADIAPVAYSHTQMPMIDAMQGVDLSRVSKRSDADEQLARHVDDAGVRAFLLQSLDVRERRWRLNLNVLAAEMHKIIGFPEVNSTFEGPVLMLSGANSDYVLPDHRARIKGLFPNVVFAKLPGAGHWLHADKPREFEAAIDAFLTV